MLSRQYSVNRVPGWLPYLGNKEEAKLAKSLRMLPVRPSHEI